MQEYREGRSYEEVLQLLNTLVVQFEYSANGSKVSIYIEIPRQRHNKRIYFCRNYNKSFLSVWGLQEKSIIRLIYNYCFDLTLQIHVDSQGINTINFWAQKANETVE